MNFNAIFTNKPAFTIIISYLNNKDNNSLLRCCKSLQDFGQSNEQVQKIFCRNLGVLEKFSDCKTWKETKLKIKSLFVGATKIAWTKYTEEIELSKMVNCCVKIGNWIAGDGVLQECPDYYTLYNTKDKAYFSPSKLYLKSHDNNSNPILIYSLDAGDQPLNCIGTLDGGKELADNSYKAMCTLFNDFLGVTLHVGGGDCSLVLWNLENKQLISNMPVPTELFTNPTFFGTDGITMFISSSKGTFLGKFN